MGDLDGDLSVEVTQMSSDPCEYLLDEELISDLMSHRGTGVNPDSFLAGQERSRGCIWTSTMLTTMMVALSMTKCLIHLVSGKSWICLAARDGGVTIADNITWTTSNIGCRPGNCALTWELILFNLLFLQRITLYRKKLFCFWFNKYDQGNLFSPTAVDYV